MKKRYNQWIEITDFDFLKKKAEELKLEKSSAASLIAKMIEFCRKNWKQFVKEL